MAMRPPDQKPPRFELLETCWQLRGASGKVFDCAIYRTDAGLELRVGYDDEPVTTAILTDIEEGRTRAAKLRSIVHEKGGFEELA